MSREITLGVVAVAALLGIVLAVHLWRSRRKGDQPWSRQDSLAALGLLVAIVGVVLPLLASGGASEEEDPEVSAYRQDVASSCRSMAATTNPLMDAMDASGGFDRDKLLTGLRNQVRATQGVLGGLWKKEAPEELAEEVRSAKSASRDFLAAARSAFDRIAAKQPATMSIQQVSAALGSLDAELRPAASEMESAMSRLAGQPCAPPAQSPPS